MIDAEELREEYPQGNIPGTTSWYLAAPVPGPFWYRLTDAWAVLRGNAEAVKFRL